MNYSPFTDENDQRKNIYQIELRDLEQLREKGIEEGVHIEYKRELSNTVKKRLPNIITSFANEEGGWLFIGIDEDDMSIKYIKNKDYELMLNNILKDITSPIPRIIPRFLTPMGDNSKGVLVVWIPEGDKPPYISNGKIYRRVGSGSSPIKEIEDRYYLDSLYQKSEKKIDKLEKFCKKDISIYNRAWNVYTQNYKYLGMCNIYLIPVYDLKLLESIKPEKLKEYILNETKTSKTYHGDGVSLTINMPFEKAAYSVGSIIFRNKELLDSYESTIAWEQFFDGSAKIHIPIPYVLNTTKVVATLTEHVSNFEDPKVFDDFNYIDGKKFLYAILGSISEYFSCIKKLREEFEEIMIVIDIDHVRKNILYFDTEKYKSYISRNGIVFSDKNEYRINQQFDIAKVETSNLVVLLSYFINVIDAFGFSSFDGMKFFIESVAENNRN